MSSPSVYCWIANPEHRPVAYEDAASRRVGLELEVEGYHSDGSWNESGHWDVKNDDSLRNSGRELVFVRPLNRQYTEVALAEAREVLSSCVISHRTSVHVHVDVRDLDRLQLKALLVYYAMVESQLYKKAGKHRYSNIYCPGISDTNGVLESLTSLYRALSRGVGSSTRSYIERHCKYTGLNLRPMIELGSVEFRMHEGTTDTQRILEWVICLQNLVQYAHDNPLGSGAKEVILTARTEGFAATARKILGVAVDLSDDRYEVFFEQNLLNALEIIGDC